MRCLRLRPPLSAALALALLAPLSLLAPAHAQPQSRQPRIEVAFALDATGSMGSYIDAARARIKAIAGELAAGDPAPEIRFGLVAYRDKGDEFVTRLTPFTRDLDAMKKALDDTHAQGGGDTPEAVLEGLQMGLTKLDWSVGEQDVVKLLYVVGDAPPQRYASSPKETFLIRYALERNIVIHTIACGGISPLGEGFFERMARLTEGRAYRLEGPRRSAARGSVGATSTRSLAAAVSGSAKAYSGSVGVAYAPADRPRETARALRPRSGDGRWLPAGDEGYVEQSGLIGPQLRVVRDPASWSDLWSAHVSVHPGPEVPTPPKVDFDAHTLLVLGGGDAGLTLARLEKDGEAGIRWAFVEADDAPGVRFLLVPASDAPIVAKGAF